MTSKIPATDDAPADMLSTLARILADVGGVAAEEITVESRLSEDLAISSLNLIEAVVHVEDTFGVRVEDEDIQDFTTVGDVVAFIEKSRSAAAQ